MTLLKRQKTNGDSSSVLSNLVEDFFNESVPAWTGYSRSPRVNVREEANQFNIQVAVPGFSKEDFNIELVENQLTISASRQQESEENEEGYTRREFDYSSFSRSFTLPESVNADSIKCTYENGLLKVTVPKKEGTQEARKTISVS